MFTEAEIWDQLYSLSNRAQAVVTKFTVPLLVYQESVRNAGTGVLLRIASRSFIVSAAHVMDFTFYDQIQFYTTVSTDVSQPIPIRFLTRTSSARDARLSKSDPDRRAEDLLDISVAELHPDSADELDQRYRFLRIDDIDPSPLKTASGILVFGFPSALSLCNGQAVYESLPLGMVTTTLQDEPAARHKNCDILLYYPDDVRDTIQGGERRSCHPGGLSGCGIWRISEPPVFPKDAQLEDIRLVGIQHSYRKNRQYIIGTSAARILQIVWEGFPEFRPALQLLRRPC